MPNLYVGGAYRFNSGVYHVSFVPKFNGSTVEADVEKHSVVHIVTILNNESDHNLKFRWESNAECGFGMTSESATFKDRNGNFLFRTVAPVAYDSKGWAVDVTSYADAHYLVYNVTGTGHTYPITVKVRTTIQSSEGGSR